MGLQTQNLVMVGLGVKNDTPPNAIQPPLKDGIHLRWAFRPELGFPWYGFYLFRRSQKALSLCLSNVMRSLKTGWRLGADLDIPNYGHLSSDQGLVLSDDFPPPGLMEFSLDGRQYLRLTLPLDRPAWRIEARIGFRREAEIQVAALLGNVPVARSTVSGLARQIVTVMLGGDAISAITFSSGPAALIELCLVTVQEDALTGWEPVPDFPYPLCLPLTHPDYPCTAGMPEDLTAARELARSRILYGHPNQVMPPSRLLTATGTVSLVPGSPLVLGTGTEWTADLVGGVFQADGDMTSYTITNVVSPDKLVLSRGYGGPERAGSGYSIALDSFGQLHDSLVHLVQGGSGAGTMEGRFIPTPIATTGAVEVTTGESSITGVGTNWGPELTGLSLQIIGANTGTLAVTTGSPTVQGTGTSWDVDLVGMTLQIFDERTAYTVVGVDPPTQQLTLDRPYAGTGGSGRAYMLIEPTVYTVIHVDAATRITLDRSYDTLEHAYDGSPPTVRTFTRAYLIGERLESAEPGGTAPTVPRQYLLDLVLLASLHPAVAQMTGLYWLDRTVHPGEVYDYLLLADYANLLGGTAETALNWLSNGTVDSFEGVEGYIVFNKQAQPAPPLAPPSNVRVYALPAMATGASSNGGNDGVAGLSQNSAGLRWNLGRSADGAVLGGQAIMYHVWRAALGNGETPATTPRYELLTRELPLLIGEQQLSSTATLPQTSGWPPFRLSLIDRGLPDGWYSYQVSGIDIFGRHSPNSSAAGWYQWSPLPDPRPWYAHDAPGESMVLPFAVRLLDKIAPPPPTDIEARVLDPADPFVLADAAYRAWRAEHPGEIGLRVRWLWTQAQWREAPDTQEFRVYYQPGQMNALLGRTRSVSEAGAAECLVETDIPNTHPVNAYVGAQLQIGASAFPVVTSDAESPLRLRVKALEPVPVRGTVALTSGSSLVMGTETAWGPELVGLIFRVTGEPTEYTILNVVSPSQLMLAQVYSGASGDGRNYTIVRKLPRANRPCTVALPAAYSTGTVMLDNGSPTVYGTETYWRPELVGSLFTIAGGQTEYAIIRVDSPSQLTLDRPFAGGSFVGANYRIRHPLAVDYTLPRNWQQRCAVVGYDEDVTKTVSPMLASGGKVLYGAHAATVVDSVVTLVTPETPLDQYPDLSDAQKAIMSLFTPFLLLEDDTNRPTRMYRVLAVDNSAKTVTVDGTPAIGGSPSSWAIGWPARAYEVFLPMPDVGAEQPFEPTLSNPVVYARIGVSTADDKLHTPDDPKWAGSPLGGRPGNEGRVGPAATIFRVLRKRPSAPVPPPIMGRVFASAADYHDHSFYTYRWLPDENLKTHIFRALDDALFKIDWARRQPPRPPLTVSQTEFFPDEAVDPRWDEQKRTQVANELNQLNNFAHDAAGTEQAMAYYAGLSNDALRVLGGLPGNEQAFTQITIQPLDPQEPDPDNPLLLRWRNRRGPDDPDNFVAPDPTGTNPLAAETLRVYIDTLDGRATNRYFYRAAYVDGAHNRSELSLSGPPVYLPDLKVPERPQLLKVLGGQRQAIIQWSIRQDAGIRRCLIYRTDIADNGRDIRLMGNPVADLPAMPLIVERGEVDLGQGTDITLVERVYAAAGFNPSRDLLHGQTSQQYLAAPDPPIGTRITGLTAPDGTAVVVVYRDSRDGMQYTPAITAPLVWYDEGLVGARTYYYRVVAIRAGENRGGTTLVSSLPSDLGAVRVVDLSPPDPPTITTLDWVRVGQDGTIFRYTDPVPTDEVRLPAVRLTWTSVDPNLTCLVQFRRVPDGGFTNASGWLSRGSYEFVHRNDLWFLPLEYRIKVINQAGNTNRVFAPRPLPAVL